MYETVWYVHLEHYMVRKIVFPSLLSKIHIVGKKWWSWHTDVSWVDVGCEDVATDNIIIHCTKHFPIQKIESQEPSLRFDVFLLCSKTNIQIRSKN